MLRNKRIVIEKPADMPDYIFRMIQLGAKECRLQYQLEELQKELEEVQAELKQIMNFQGDSE